jgi:hypothetical protein
VEAASGVAEVMARNRALTEPERLQLDRDAALREVLTCTAGLHELSARTERAIRELASRRLAPILEAADALVVAGQELEAIDRRLDTHVQVHADCLHPRPCWGYRVLQVRRRHVQRQWDRAYRRLAGG